ncbi:hypothetical protein QBC43DRAFT_327174 [Cladorrhinum sp. PSN259]|nr:hypothetical protein QBC43DRAFT_327174 [Cladorrhinum sp. PSN259]
MLFTPPCSDTGQKIKESHLTVQLVPTSDPERLQILVPQPLLDNFKMSITMTRRVSRSDHLSCSHIRLAIGQLWVSTCSKCHGSGNDRAPKKLRHCHSGCSVTTPVIYSPDSEDEDDDDLQLESDSPFTEFLKPLEKEAHAKFISTDRIPLPCSTKRPSAEEDGPMKRCCKSVNQVSIESTECLPRRERCRDSEDSYAALTHETRCVDTWGPISFTRRRQSLACPFYKRTTAQYRHHCLLTGGFTSIQSLRSHIERAHRRAPYCPTCHLVFASSSSNAELDRREHIRARQCERREGPIAIEGLQGDQMDRLCELEPTGTEIEQWMQIWDLVYPSFERPFTPYLDERKDKYVRLVRAASSFWERKGRSSIMEFLQSSEEGAKAISACRDLKRDIESLQKIILRGLLQQLLLGA